MRVEVVASRAEWPTQFAAEREHLAGVLGEQAVAIEHVGSTSIPGLAAKPIIDIQVGIVSLPEFDASDAADRLCGCGFVHRTDLQPIVPYRRFFKRLPGGEGPAVNLHITEAAHPWHDRILLFRDHLRASESARRRYQALKLDLSGREWADIHAYTDAKDELIWQLEEEAFDHFGLDDNQRARILSSRV